MALCSPESLRGPWVAKRDNNTNIGGTMRNVRTAG